MAGALGENAGLSDKVRGTFARCHPSSLAPLMALISCVLFCLNGELLQALQTVTPKDEQRPSPGFNLLLCHLGGLVFAPSFLRSTAYDKPAVTPGAGDETSLSVRLMGKPRLCALIFAILLMGYNYCWLLSARFLLASVTTAIMQTSVGMVYAMSVPMFGEALTFVRVLGIGLLIVGSMLASGVTTSRYHDDAHPTSGAAIGAGVGLALLAAIGYAMYQVLFRHLFGQWKHDPRFLAFFGAWISVWHVLVILPLLVLSSHLGFEALVVPRGHYAVLGTMVSAGIASTVNTLYLCIALWGSVMLLPCISALAVPMTVMLDMVLHRAAITPVELVGHGLVVVAVVLIMDLARGLIAGRHASFGLGKQSGGDYEI